MRRLLKGEAIDAVSRDTQMPAHELEEWRRVQATLSDALRERRLPGL